jgi:hypothetical protein
VFRCAWPITISPKGGREAGLDQLAALVSAADDPRAGIRVAAAIAAAAVPAAPSDQILQKLLADPEPAVRKFAVRSASPRNSAAVLQRVREISVADADPRLQREARERISSISDG